VIKITERSGDFSEFFKNWRLTAVFFDFLEQPFGSWRRDNPLRAEQVRKFVESSNRSTILYGKFGDLQVVLYGQLLQNVAVAEAFAGLTLLQNGKIVSCLYSP
jgi:hypothetical protein